MVVLVAIQVDVESLSILPMRMCSVFLDSSYQQHSASIPASFTVNILIWMIRNSTQPEPVSTAGIEGI